ncbi:hypothetical protein M3Y97_00919100 [Aphelenchoides bicaudatus]|nr:hypothetical protein M3Y97_00919100 [Aphelenchoides bicaudatus]
MERISDNSTALQLNAEQSYEIRNLVRRHIQDGSTREDTFSKVFYKLFDRQIGAEQINEYFQRLDNEPGYNWEENCSFNIYNLLSIIAEEFEVTRSAIAVWSDESYKSFMFLNARYGLLYDIALRYLFLLDNYTGKRREINIDDTHSFFDSNSYYSLKVLDQNYLLCTESNSNNQRSTVSLLQLDIAESTVQNLGVLNFKRARLARCSGFNMSKQIRLFGH